MVAVTGVSAGPARGAVAMLLRGIGLLGVAVVRASAVIAVLRHQLLVGVGRLWLLVGIVLALCVFVSMFF